MNRALTQRTWSVSGPSSVRSSSTSRKRRCFTVSPMLSSRIVAWFSCMNRYSEAPAAIASL